MSVSELCGGGGGGSGSGRAFERGGFRSYVSLRYSVKVCSFKYSLSPSLSHLQISLGRTPFLLLLIFGWLN